VFVEAYLHGIAKRLDAINLPAAIAWRGKQSAPPERAGYARWELMGDDRGRKYSTHLWHDANCPADYAALAASWALPYAESDFTDPNEGAGLGEPS
jgi:hypothetical protein